MEQRFAKYVSKTATETGCFLWTGCAQQVTPNYRRPFFSVATSKPESAARVAYRLAKGEIPKEQCIRHTCDNSMCVNPEHLVLGTHADNMRDMKDRGRGGVPHPTCRGENHPQAKLTEDLVREIRSSTETRNAIATRLGVSPATIKAIRTGRMWKHIQEYTK